MQIGQVCLAALLLVFLGRAWILVVLDLVWLHGNRNTPGAGGHCSACVRNRAIRRHIRDYLPISARHSGTVRWLGAGLQNGLSGPSPPKSNVSSPVGCAPSVPQLVKTADLDPSWNYLFGFHPHRVLVSGACSNFCTEATGFSHLFPHLQPHLLTLPCWFQLPVFQDYIMCAGEESAGSQEPQISVLGQDQRLLSLVPAPGGLLGVGGPLEAWEAKPGALSFRIRNQKRFVKLAPEEGSAAGEERSAPRAGSGRPPLWPPVPPTVGAPIPAQRTPRPSRARVDAQHEVYLERLEQLLKEHKARSGVPADGHLPPPRRAAGPHRPLQATPGGPRGVATQTRKASPARTEIFTVCPPSPGALLAEGERVGVSTAPPPSRSMKTLKKQRLEVLSAYCYLLTFLFTGPFCSLLLLFLLFTSLRYFSVLYLVRFFLDRDTHPAPQGILFSWYPPVYAFFPSSCPLPPKLVKTVELPPDRSYLLVAHPHGIMAMGILCNFSTESSGFSQQFPRLQPLTAMLNGLFHIPAYRDYLLSFGES
ncbi:hypothetical protein J1605_016601 [Eschrichtius robustus]|uniref:2-acylglycerol O-acyltransferase 3 n=1 Tax=Eschrichtius robustus TaxID=9764 RepID=A0AB34I385_ESCRO|nr:hypothetical protein J1605_016601 [Eschrichtius robustus]